MPRFAATVRARKLLQRLRRRHDSDIRSNGHSRGRIPRGLTRPKGT
jgi:hypothetical protein